MVDHTAMQLALRAHMVALEVCTTGAMSLAASAAGYTRADGSFLTDGFRVGMEVQPAGFPQADVGVVSQVSPLLLSITGGREVAAADAGRTITVGLPACRVWDNEDEAIPPGRPYVEEDYVPAPGALFGLSSGGPTDDTGLYILKWYGLRGTGIAGMTRCVDRLLEHARAGVTLALPDGNRLRIRGNPKPWREQILDASQGLKVMRVLFPWRLLALNTPVS